LAGERSVAVGASETLPMPGLVLVGHASARNDLVAFHATSCKLLFVAGSAVDLLLPGDEALGPDGRFADAAAEALLVPLPRLVLHLLGSSSEDLAATVASRSKLSIVAVATVNLVGFAAELLVYE